MKVAEMTIDFARIDFMELKGVRKTEKEKNLSRGQSVREGERERERGEKEGEREKEKNRKRNE